MEGSQIIIISLSSSVSRSRQGPRWYCPRPLALAVSLVQLHLELGQGAGAEENCHFFFFFYYSSNVFLVKLAARGVVLSQGQRQEWAGRAEEGSGCPLNSSGLYWVSVTQSHRLHIADSFAALIFVLPCMCVTFSIIPF